MMTLEEAVATYEQYVLDAKQEKLNETYKYYSQLAAWLRELVERRKAPEIIFCKNCTRRKKNTETGEYYCRASGLRNTDYDFCSGGKRVERGTE